MYVATIAFSACGGCHSSLLSAGEPLVALLCEHNIAFSSYLVDRRSVTPSDVVIATGGIRNEEELELASEISRSSRKVIAVGSCAVYGGVAGIRSIEAPHADQNSGLPPLTAEVQPLDSCMGIELYVPGCPPPPHLVFESLRSLLDGYGPGRFDGTVCSECDRTVNRKPVKAWSYQTGGVAYGGCLLDQGLLCLGPVTRGGCHSPCPRGGAICLGCRGPSDAVLSSQLHSMYSDMVRFVSLSTGAREGKVAAKLSRLLDTLYMFTASDPVTRARVRERTPEV